jgi:thiol-disulfide isomerase/thioredoxin
MSDGSGLQCVLAQTHQAPGRLLCEPAAPYGTRALPPSARLAALLPLANRALQLFAFLSCSLLAATASWALTGQERATAAGEGLVGSRAPALAITTIDGRVIDLGKLYGKQAVYLKFWATWCVPCRQQMPHLKRTFESAGPHLAVIAVNAGFDDPIEDVKAYQREMGLAMPVVRDDRRLAAAFNLRVTPQHIVIGRDGRIQYVGHLADERLEEALRMAQATVPAKEPTQEAAPATHASPSAGKGPGVGELLPDVTVRTLAGASFPAHDPSDRRPTAIVFISAFCESYLATSRPKRASDCRAVREQVEGLAADTRVRWIAMASGLWTTEEELGEYRSQYGIVTPLSLDESGKVFRRFHVSSVPTIILADADGRIARRIEGVDPGLAPALEAMLRR